jgi:hypothetical protein
LDEVVSAPDVLDGALRFLGAAGVSVELVALPALVDSREAAPAEASVASAPVLRELLADGVVLLLEPLDGSDAELVDGLAALPALDELWANAPVATPAARAATAHSVVILRMMDSSFAPSAAQQLAETR